MTQKKNNRWLNEVRIIRKALSDTVYLHELLKNPRRTIETEFSISLENVNVTIFRETEEVMHFVIPQKESELGTTDQTSSISQKTSEGYLRRLGEAMIIEKLWQGGQQTFHLSPEDLTEKVIQTFNLSKVSTNFRVQLHHEEKGELFLSIPYYLSKPYLSFKEEVNVS